MCVCGMRKGGGLGWFAAVGFVVVVGVFAFWADAGGAASLDRRRSCRCGPADDKGNVQVGLSDDW